MFENIIVCKLYMTKGNSVGVKTAVDISLGIGCSFCFVSIFDGMLNQKKKKRKKRKRNKKIIYLVDRKK